MRLVAPRRRCTRCFAAAERYVKYRRFKCSVNDDRSLAIIPVIEGDRGEEHDARFWSWPAKDECGRVLCVLSTLIVENDKPGSLSQSGSLSSSSQSLLAISFMNSSSLSVTFKPQLSLSLHPIPTLRSFLAFSLQPAYACLTPLPARCAMDVRASRLSWSVVARKTMEESRLEC